MLEKVIEEMKGIFKEIPYGIDHTLMVLDNARAILEGEKADCDLQELVSIVAVLHDIGAVEAQRKYGSMDAVYQEQEGPAIVREVLGKAGYARDKTERVAYIVGHHHTPARIDGLDFQIQWEADLLENIGYMELAGDKERLIAFIEDNFATATGKGMAYRRFIGE